MFSDISWTDYSISVSILLAVYYLFVGVRYYSSNLKKLLYGKQSHNFRSTLLHESGSETILPNKEMIQTESNDFEFIKNAQHDEVEHLIEQLRAVIVEASEKKPDLPEFKQYLQLVFKDYPGIKNSPFRASINELVVSECEKYGAVALSGEEVELLWKNSM